MLRTAALAALAALACVASATCLGAQDPASWRQATESELKDVIPARAPVEKEHIETETHTASGVTDGSGRFIAGAVLITAGYSAEGKYSHFLITQVPLRIGGVPLAPGEYVLGFKHQADSISVSLYAAQTGTPLGTVRAERLSRAGRIESFHIFPPSEHSVIAIGRFGFNYQIVK